MKETYEKLRFKKKFKALLKPINQIITDYAAQGYDLSVRQLHYRLVAKNLIPNTLQMYKSLVGLVTNARLAGLLDWTTIVDRHRKTHRWASWGNIREFLADVKDDFSLDHWEGQPNYVEVMIEKDALAGVVLPICSRLHVTFTANKGYSSSSALYRAGKRFRHEQLVNGKELHLIYLGDHDPSGIHMTQDLADRVKLFAGPPFEFGGPAPMDINVHRIALNMDQVKKFNPPENFAKEADPRAGAYKAKFGFKCWELDALEPEVIDKLITDKVAGLRDDEAYQKVLTREKKAKAELNNFINKKTKRKKRK